MASPRRRSAPHHPLFEQAYDELIAALKNHSAVSEVKAIVEKCPKGLRALGCEMRGPLFDALSCGAGLDVVQFLVEQIPPSLLNYGDDEYDYYGTPLHFALERGAYSDDDAAALIKFLVHKSPQALRAMRDTGGLPAHVAVRKGRSLEAVRAVVEPFPVALRLLNPCGHLPLTLALVKYSHRSNDGESTEYLRDLVRYLATACPDSLGDKGHHGERALHVAAEAGAPPDILSFLLELRPQALRETTKIGDLPVHCAARSSHTPSGYAAFQHLVELWPESVQLDDCFVLFLLLTSDISWDRNPPVPSVPLIDRVRYVLDLFPPAIRMKRGITQHIPLHHALLNNTPHNVLDLLLDRWPESIHELDMEGASILQVVSKASEVSLDTLQFLVQRDETIVDLRHAKDGSLPVHTYAGADDAALDLVRVLVELRPQSVTARDDQGCLPIHRAVANPNQAQDVIEYLVGQRPDTLAEKNDQGALPLHVAVAVAVANFDVSLETVAFLVDQRPESLMEGDNDGDLPIHDAISPSRLRPNLIRFLAERDPDSILVRNNRGWSPLHFVVLAATQSDSVEVAQILIEHRPDAAAFGNNGGLLPLHLAAMHAEQCLDLVEVLLAARPDTAMTPERDGYLALHCAVGAESSTLWPLEVARCLIACSPDALMVATTDGTRRLPIHCALSVAHSWSSDASMVEQDPVRLSLVQLLVETAPTSLQVEDGRGTLPLAVAALNWTTPLDVLFLLMTAWPGSVSALIRPRPSKRSRRE